MAAHASVWTNGAFMLEDAVRKKPGEYEEPADSHEINEKNESITATL